MSDLKARIVLAASLTLLLARPRVARAADCKAPDWAPQPPPGYVIDDCEERAWDSVALTSDGSRTVDGQRISVDYKLDDESKDAPDATVREWYVNAGRKAGATVEKNESYEAFLRRAGPQGDVWYHYEHGNGSETSTGSYTVSTIQVAPLPQGVVTRAMPGALNVEAPCADPAWLVKDFPGFKRGDCEGKAYDTVDLDLSSGKKTLSGKRVAVTYELPDEAQPPVNAAVQRNFANAWKKSGAQIALGDAGPSNQVVAHQASAAGGELWMVWDAGSGNDEGRTSYTLTTWEIAPLALEVVARVPPANAPPAAAGCHDPDWLVKQFSYFKLDGCDDRDFDSVELPTADGGAKRVAGRVHEESYVLTDDQKNPTALAVRNNYVQALQKIGAKLLSDPDRDQEALLVRKSADGDVYYWWKHGSGSQTSTTSYSLLTLEPPAKPSGCKVEVYGLNFDFDKATLRPDSEPVLRAVLALFQKDPTMKSEIGGHTDDVGTHVHNQTLSEQRADAVKTWLVAHGVAAERLTTHGYGDSKPLVPNKDDASRAKNRRVELTRQDCSAK